MLPLAGSRFPESVEELVTALRAGLAGLGISPRDLQADGEWPRVQNLSIDLTGAHVSRATPLPRMSAEVHSTIVVENLALSAAPLVFEDTPVHVHLHGSGMECGFALHSSGKSDLHLLRANNGSVVIEANRTDLESALKSLAQTFLAKHGAEVKSAELKLVEHSSRSLGIRAEITAKAFVMTARLVVTGQLELDEQFNLRIRDLAATGNGVIASLATSLLRPRFAEIEKHRIPLAAYSFAGVTLHGVRIKGGNTLRIEAQFGAESPAISPP